MYWIVFGLTLTVVFRTSSQQGCSPALTCDLTSCPMVPSSTCQVDMDSCSVSLVDDEGNVVNCTDCPPGSTPADCPRPLPCESATCPSSPSALCVNTFCDSCKPLFVDENGNLRDEAACLVDVGIEFPPLPSVTCVNPPTPTFGFVADPRPLYLVGETLSFICPEETMLQGSQNTSCLDTGLFTEIDPNTACVDNFQVQCSVMAPVDGFVVGDADLVRLGTTVQYECNENFTLIGERSAVCEDTGMLSYLVPICINCPPSASCEITTCPNVQNFSCSINLASCEVEVFDPNGNLLSEEDCRGACPLSVSCDLATCQNVPDFTCSVNQATCVVETFDENGNLLSDEACGRECPIGVPLAGCQGLLPCEREACPGVTGATCTNNFCGGCNAVFTDSDGNVLSEEDCRLACPLTVSCDLATCPNVPNFTCSVNQATCVVETFDENGDLLSDEACGRECPVGVPLASCSEPLPCESLSCPSVQGATCTNNFCGGCSAVFTDSDGNVLSNEDCATDNCPSDRPRYLCHVPPCERYACPGYSGAVCTNDYCGGCRAVFRGRNGNVLNEFQCRSKDSCPLERPRVACPAVPCDIRSCPAVPGATCESDYCGGCHAVFSDSQGKVYSREECNPADNCPRLFNSANPASFQASCLNGYRVGSRCRLSCQRGYTLQGGVYQVECMRSRLWSPSLRGVTCYKPSCPPVPDSMYFNSRCLFGTTVGSSCIIQCKNSNPPRTWQITCLYNQQWSRSPSSITCRPRVAQCPIVQRNPSQLFAVSCSDGGRVGSRCDARCPSNYEVRGTKSITCQSSERWSGAFSFTLCVSRAISHCTTQTCSYSPCSGVRCPAFPQARCLPSCYGCGVHFYINTRRLTPSQCAAQGLFSCSTRHCGNRCRFSRCPTNAYAHCRIHCDCSIAYYDLRTSQRVTCFAAPVGK